MPGSGIGRKIFVLGLLGWTIYPQPAAGTHILHADVSVGVKVDSNNTSASGQSCEITTGEQGCQSKTDYMLVRFDFADYPDDTIVFSAGLRLTRSGGQSPNSYTVYAYGFCGDNTDWYLAPQNATGFWQYHDNGGNDDIPWKNSSGQADTIENADYWLGSSGNTWDGETVEISLDVAKVQNWITGVTPDNGMRLQSNKTSVPYFYGSGAANQADRPTLIIEAIAPEPASLVLLTIGAFGLLARRKKQGRLSSRTVL